MKAFIARMPALPLQPSPTINKIEDAAVALTNDIDQTNTKTLQKRWLHHPKAFPWWNAAYMITVQNLKSTQGPVQTAAHTRLKGAIHAAKRKWADDYIEKAQLWDIAAWRHRRRISKIPSLRGANGLAHAHKEMTNIFAQHFFPQTPPTVDMHFPDNPPPCPTQELPHIDKAMIGSLLNKAANQSVPGQSGHTWMLIKWACVALR
jgi:hypothetical protein